MTLEALKARIEKLLDGHRKKCEKAYQAHESAEEDMFGGQFDEASQAGYDWGFAEANVAAYQIFLTYLEELACSN